MAEDTRWSRLHASRLLAPALSLLFVLLIRVPWVPSLFEASCPTTAFCKARQMTVLSPTDASYLLALHELEAKHADFSQHPFTFGPWGFVYHGYHPATYSRQIIASLFLAIAFWWACYSIAGRIAKQNWLRALLVCALAILSWRGFDIDVGFYSFIALLIAYYFFPGADPVGDGPGLLLVAACALISLIKFSFMLTALPIVLLIALDECWRRRRWPRYLAVYVAGLAAFWIIAHQPVGSFVAYLRNSWEVTRGFEDAMAGFADAPEQSARDGSVPSGLILYVIAAMLSLGLAAWTGARRNRFFSAGGVLALAYLFYVALKSSYVRFDDLHAPHATLVSQFTAAVLVCCLWKTSGSRIYRYFAVGVLLYASLLTCRQLSIMKQNPVAQILVCLDSVPGSAKNAMSWLTGANPAARKFPGEMQGIRETLSLPKLSGTVDLYPYNTSLLIAYGLDYQPRPALQSYCAYTPFLANLDAESLRSKNAVEWVFFDGHPISDRYPSLEDSTCWPELLTRYEVTGETNPYVWGTPRGYTILHKSPAPRRYQMTPISQSVGAFRQELTVPMSGDHAIWVEIEIEHSAAGVMLATLYKTPPIWLNVTTADGHVLKYSLPAGMARAGFLLSPVVSSRKAFEKFAASDWNDSLSGAKVTRLQFTAGDDPSSERYFKPEIAVRFFTLDFPRTR